MYDVVIGIIMFVMFAVGLPLMLFSAAWAVLYVCTHDWWIE